MKKNKNIVFGVSLVGAGTFFLLRGLQMINFWCGMYNYDCQDNINLMSYYLFLFLPILLFLIVTYFLKDQIFKTWSRFTYWYTPVYILIIFFLSDNNGGWFSYLFSSKFWAVNLTVIYTIVSLILVIYKMISLRKPQIKVNK